MKTKMMKTLMVLSLLMSIACKEQSGLTPIETASAPTANGNSASTLTLQGSGGN